jgi:predicted porin
MKKVSLCAATIFGLAALARASTASADDTIVTKAPPKPAAPPAPAACAGVVEFFTTSCPLSWSGITVYGTVDTGVAWQSHGVRFNPSYGPGHEQLISSNSNRAIWNPAPNGLSQSFIGIKGKEQFAPGWSFIFDLQAGFDPYSLQLANGPKSQLANNGIPAALQSSNGDSSRAGQYYNGVGYAGVSSPTYGTLTVGRQNSLTLDGVIAYDPQAASYAFSLIGYSGTTAGVGDTEDARFSTAAKYRVDIGQFRAAALYQFGGYQANNASTDAYQLQAGVDIPVGAYGKFSFDAIYSRVDDAVASLVLSAAQNALFPGTLAARISDDSSVMLLGKYTYGPVQAYGGYERIAFAAPSNPQTTFVDIGGYTVVSADISNSFFDGRVLDVSWTGAKYSVTQDVDLVGAYYHLSQNTFATGANTGCHTTVSAQCAGAEDAYSLSVDWKFAKKFDAYAGLMYSRVTNGLASGFLFRNTVDPTAGLRFRF